MNKLKRGMFCGSHYLCHISTTRLERNKATLEKSIALKAEIRGKLGPSERFQFLPPLDLPETTRATESLS